LGLTPVPQLWGNKSLPDCGKYVVEGYANYALGMNECNEYNQSNLNPEEAAALWRQYMAPLRSKGYQLGSPAMSSNPNGTTWTQNFVKTCPDCTWDFTCIHWYDMKFENFTTYVNKWHDDFKKDIWITEFALHNFNDINDQPTTQQIYDFHVQVAQWVKTVDWIVMVAPYAFVSNTDVLPSNSFINDAATALTPLGEAIIAIYNS